MGSNGPAKRPARVSTLAALAVREFRLLFIGMVLSNVGTWMQNFALGVLVVQLAVNQGNPQLAPFYIGLIGLARAVPAIGFGLFGGVIADRFERRLLLVLVQVAGGICSLALGLLILTERADIVSIVVLAALLAVGSSIEGPARQAMMPNLVERRLLPSAFSLGGITNNGSVLVGPLIGGLLIVPIGIAGLVFVNAASYLVLIAVLFMMKKQEVDPKARKTSMLQSLAEGVRYARNEEIVRTLIIMFAAAVILGRPYVQLLPAFATDALGVGAVELSWLLAATGLGGLAGSFMVTTFSHIERRGVVILTLVATFSVALLLLSAQRTLLPTLVLGVIAGATSQIFAVLNNVTTTTILPDRVRGRVASIQTLTIQGGMPLGTLVLGTIGSFTSTAASIAIGGVLVLAVCAMVAVRVPVFRIATISHLNERADAARAVAEAAKP